MFKPCSHHSTANFSHSAELSACTLVHFLLSSGSGAVKKRLSVPQRVSPPHPPRPGSDLFPGEAENPVRFAPASFHLRPMLALSPLPSQWVFHFCETAGNLSEKQGLQTSGAPPGGRNSAGRAAVPQQEDSPC